MMHLAESLEEAYLSYLLDYDDIQAFASHNNLSEDMADILLKAGRLVHDRLTSGEHT